MIHPYQSRSLLFKTHQTCKEQTGDLHKRELGLTSFAFKRCFVFTPGANQFVLHRLSCPAAISSYFGCQWWKAQQKVAPIHKPFLNIPFQQQVKIGLTRAIKTNKVQLTLYLTQLETICKNVSSQKSVHVFSVVNSSFEFESTTPIILAHFLQLQSSLWDDSVSVPSYYNSAPIFRTWHWFG